MPILDTKKHTVIIFLTTAFAFLLTAAAIAQESIQLPPGTLSAEEIVELFSGNTVESETAVRKRTSISYYDQNGEIRQLRNGTLRQGHWRVQENGRICLQMEDRPEKCRIIVNDNGVYKKYIVKSSGRHQHSVTYKRFIPGNPEGL